MTSDKKYIDRIKRDYNKRHKTALLTLTMAVIFSAAGIYGYQMYMDSIHNALEAFKLLNVDQPVTDTDIKSVETTMQIAVILGAKVGVFIGTVSAAIGFLIALAVTQFFGMRKDKLLIKYYEKSKN